MPDFISSFDLRKDVLMATRLRPAVALLSIISTISAHVIAAPANHTMKIEWTKDGQAWVHGIAAVIGPTGQPEPYTFQSGNSTGYATCSPDGAGRRLVSRQAFTGTTLIIKPVSIDRSSVSAQVSASDTVMKGVHESGDAACPSQVVDIAGPHWTDIPVILKDGETTEVPLDNPHYRLRISLEPY